MGLLVKGLGVKTDSHPHNIINNPTSYMAVESDTGPLLHIRFLVERGKKICGGALARGYRVLHVTSE